jgi:hypothetical protein
MHREHLGDRVQNTARPIGEQRLLVDTPNRFANLPRLQGKFLQPLDQVVFRRPPRRIGAVPPGYD